MVDEGLIDELIQKVFAAGGLSEAPEMVAAIFNDLWKGVIDGLGVDYDTLDADFIASLRTNVSQFSDAKNYTMLRELNGAMLKADGTLATFAEFQEAARKITDIYLKNYLQTEYNLAVAGAQMAAKWKRILEQKETLPYLLFDAVIDARSSKVCPPLNGIVLRVDNPRWKTITPPNHFGCRSTLRQLPYGQVTPEDKVPAIDIPDMFKTNLGERGLIFPPKHPYFIK